MRFRLFNACALKIIAGISLALNFSTPAWGDTILNFFDANETFTENEVGYGDNVASASQAGYTYGDTDSVFTPNITLDFDGLQSWTTGYGDLSNVVYVDSGAGASGSPVGSASITLTASAGYKAVLHSVDLAGFAGDFDFDTITVTGGDVPFSLSNVPAPGAGHNPFSFGGISGSQLTITFLDSDSAEQAGIDNLRFSQIVVPEPASSTLLLAALVVRMRRRS